jgi:hypothetical protein
VPIEQFYGEGEREDAKGFRRITEATEPAGSEGKAIVLAGCLVGSVASVVLRALRDPSEAFRPLRVFTFAVEN